MLHRRLLFQHDVHHMVDLYTDRTIRCTHTCFTNSGYECECRIYYEDCGRSHGRSKLMSHGMLLHHLWMLCSGHGMRVPPVLLRLWMWISSVSVLPCLGLAEPLAGGVAAGFAYHGVSFMSPYPSVQTGLLFLLWHSRAILIGGVCCQPRAPAPTHPLCRTHEGLRRHHKLAITRLYIICNPYGGVGKGKHILDTICMPMCREAGVEVTVLDTEYAGHARDYAHTLDVSETRGVYAMQASAAACCHGDDTRRHVHVSSSSRLIKVCVSSVVMVRVLPLAAVVVVRNAMHHIAHGNM